MGFAHSLCMEPYILHPPTAYGASFTNKAPHRRFEGVILASMVEAGRVETGTGSKVDGAIATVKPRATFPATEPLINHRYRAGTAATKVVTNLLEAGAATKENDTTTP